VFVRMETGHLQRSQTTGRRQSSNTIPHAGSWKTAQSRSCLVLMPTIPHAEQEVSIPVFKNAPEQEKKKRENKKRPAALEYHVAYAPSFNGKKIFHEQCNTIHYFLFLSSEGQRPRCYFHAPRYWRPSVGPLSCSIICDIACRWCNQPACPK